MRATYQNSGTAISIGIFFTLVIAGVASNLPGTLSAGLIRHGHVHDHRNTRPHRPDQDRAARDGLPERDPRASRGTMGQRIGPEAAQTMFHADSPATQIHDEIAPQRGDIVVRKTRVGPFGTTDLDDQLQSRGIDTLILAGISTSGVVLSAIRDGHDRDYRLTVVSDLCADPEPDVNTFLVQRIFPRQAEVVTRDELAARAAVAPQVRGDDLFGRAVLRPFSTPQKAKALAK
jgi:nicotinamidase-related amidase